MGNHRYRWIFYASVVGCPWWQLDTYSQRLPGWRLDPYKLTNTIVEILQTTDRDVKTYDHEWPRLWRGREHWKEFYSNVINFNFNKYKLTSTKGTPESKVLVTNLCTSGSKDQVPTKGTRQLRLRIFSDIYGCPSYHKTGESILVPRAFSLPPTPHPQWGEKRPWERGCGESYYSLRQLDITNWTDNYYKMRSALLLQNA